MSAYMSVNYFESTLVRNLVNKIAQTHQSEKKYAEPVEAPGECWYSKKPMWCKEWGSINLTNYFSFI